MLNNEMRYKLIQLLKTNPNMSQKKTAQTLDISPGKVNYCVQTLIQTKLVKVTRFKNSHNKSAYLYLLTAQGIEKKASLALEFLQIKIHKHKTLRTEIEQMRREVEPRI